MEKISDCMAQTLQLRVSCIVFVCRVKVLKYNTKVIAIFSLKKRITELNLFDGYSYKTLKTYY